VGSHSNESEKEDDDDLELEPNVASLLHLRIVMVKIVMENVTTVTGT
jgi:hypothetical protein